MKFSRKQRGYFFLESTVFQLRKAAEIDTISAALRASDNVIVTFGDGLTIADNQGVATHCSAWGDIARVRASVVNRVHVARLSMGDCRTSQPKTQYTHGSHKQLSHVHRITSFI
jgi:hypothetical protein